jgi:hypothetical protein
LGELLRAAGWDEVRASAAASTRTGVGAIRSYTDPGSAAATSTVQAAATTATTVGAGGFEAFRCIAALATDTSCAFTAGGACAALIGVCFAAGASFTACILGAAFAAFAGSYLEGLKIVFAVRARGTVT